MAIKNEDRRFLKEQIGDPLREISILLKTLLDADDEKTEEVIIEKPKIIKEVTPIETPKKKKIKKSFDA